jgi:hypothetical protein
MVKEIYGSETSNKYLKIHRQNLDMSSINLEETSTSARDISRGLRLQRVEKTFDFTNTQTPHNGSELDKTCITDDLSSNLLWNRETDKIAHCKACSMHFPSPKQKLPGHRESFNPPVEHITSCKNLVSQWQNETHNLMSLTRKYNSLRSIPFYKPFVNEIFNRCLDLCLCPRVKRDRLYINPDEIFANFPKNNNLEPFPQISKYHLQWSQGYNHIYKSGSIRSVACLRIYRWNSFDLGDSDWKVHACMGF